MGHLSSLQDDADVDLVAVIKEIDGMLGFGAQVMLADRDVELDLLQLGRLGVLPLGPIGFLLLEAILSVIEYLADRRIGLGGDAEEVERIAGGQLIGLAGAHSSQVVAIRSDDDDFRVTDVFVDGVEPLLGASPIVSVKVGDVLFPPLVEK